MKNSVPCLVLSLFFFFLSNGVFAECRKVADEDFIKLNPQAIESLKKIGVDRNLIFQSILDTSIPETNGCWAGATGNFDDQILSVGVAQWNFGQSSLQPLLKRFRDSFLPEDAFTRERDRLAPTYGRLIFSEGCLRTGVTAECKSKLLALQQKNGQLDPVFKQEINALFESNPMIQIQTDTFVSLVGKVRDALANIFPNSKATPRAIKWAIDTAVQQGGFPGAENINRVRKTAASLTADQKRVKLKSLLHWYEGISSSIDQGGVIYDVSWNLKQWNCLVDKKAVDDEQFDLINLTFLRSRIANGLSGYWQALTLQRRLKIILGVGSVSGRRDGACV